jgi:tetratricopeptide (TPR) repeat protein
MTEGRLGRVGAHIETVWGIASRGGLLLLVSGVLAVGIFEVARECLSETVVLEPVVVKGGGEHAPTVEMATQQIATYVDRIQRTGAREWRPHAFAETEQTLSIQIPGSSLTVDNVVREIANLFPQRRRVLKVSITASPAGTGYVAAVSVLGSRSPKRKECPSGSDPMGKMFECIAVEAMKIVDPLFAASYLLSEEEKSCARFQRSKAAEANIVDDMKLRLLALRDACGFGLTRQTVATIISRGRTEDQPWVSYIYGKIHLARAEALAKVDPEAQWYEFERAIKRFWEFPKENQPPSVKAILMEVYIRNGVAIQDSIKALNRKIHGDAIRHRLALAADILTDAAGELRGPEIRRLTLAEAITAGVEPQWPEERRRSDRPAALQAHMQGLILYRQWMVDTRSRYDGEDFGFAESAVEKKMLSEASDHFERASHLARQPYEFFVEWGNTVRALRDFNAAVDHYRRAGDIAPLNWIPPVNIVVTLLEKAKERPKVSNQFDALRHTSSYLTWVSDGGPYTTLVDRIADALRALSEDLAEDFAFCRWMQSVYEIDQRVTDMSHAAALKYCVDQARDSLAQQVVVEAAQRRNAAKKIADAQVSEIKVSDRK